MSNLIVQLVLVASIHYGGEKIEVDFFGNIYLIDENKIKRIDDSGNIDSYSAEFLASPTSIDASNSFKLLAYYCELNTIVILDLNLLEISKVDLLKLGLTNSIAVAQVNNTIWVFDLVRRNFRKLSFNGELLFESKPYPDISVYDADVELEVANDRLFLKTPAGIYYFDKFANFIDRIEMDNTSSVNIVSDFLYYKRGNIISRLSFENDQTEEILSVPEATDFSVSKGKLYVCYSEKVKVFNLE